MISAVTIETIFACSLERAFKTPMLCDITKVHTGNLLMPKVIACTEDEDWGKPGFGKKVIVAKSLTQKGGWAFTDNVTERVENDYWKIEVNNFQTASFGFSKFVGEWHTIEIEANKIQIKYTYSLYSKYVLLYPFNWLFTKIIWKMYMKRVLENVRKMAYSNEPYAYL